MTDPRQEHHRTEPALPELTTAEREATRQAAGAVDEAVERLRSGRRAVARIRAIVFLVAILSASPAACTPDRPPAPGDRLPDAELEVVDPTATSWSAGDRISLSDLEGRPILLDFWASWCPPCREQHRHVTELADRYGQRVAVLGILVDDTPDNALRWMAAQGAAYPTVRELDDDLADAFWIPATGLPHMAILDARRRLMWHRVGASATGVPGDVLARLDSLLATLEPAGGGQGSVRGP